MKKDPRVTGAESLIMDQLWREAPLTAEQMFGVLGPSQKWSEGTVKTLIGRLLGKGAISAEKQGRRYLYRPVLARNAYLATESDGLIDRLFGGRLAPLMLHFSQRERLSEEDLAEIKRLIAEIEHGR
ncbi:MAG: putative transcriptional regulator [Caulobacteraceae bacterium]|nr:putative transcriptional regulator [Caulobacteraceae bacterium]